MLAVAAGDAGPLLSGAALCEPRGAALQGPPWGTQHLGSVLPTRPAPRPSSFPSHLPRGAKIKTRLFLSLQTPCGPAHMRPREGGCDACFCLPPPALPAKPRSHVLCLRVRCLWSCRVSVSDVVRAGMLGSRREHSRLGSGAVLCVSPRRASALCRLRPAAPFSS